MSLVFRDRSVRPPVSAPFTKPHRWDAPGWCSLLLPWRIPSTPQRTHPPTAVGQLVDCVPRKPHTGEVNGLPESLPINGKGQLALLPGPIRIQNTKRWSLCRWSRCGLPPSELWAGACTLVLFMLHTPAQHPGHSFSQRMPWAGCLGAQGLFPGQWNGISGSVLPGIGKEEVRYDMQSRRSSSVPHWPLPRIPHLAVYRSLCHTWTNLHVADGETEAHTTSFFILVVNPHLRIFP